jgi:hypothetical protein
MTEQPIPFEAIRPYRDLVGGLPRNVLETEIVEATADFHDSVTDYELLVRQARQIQHLYLSPCHILIP